MRGGSLPVVLSCRVQIHGHPVIFRQLNGLWTHAFPADQLGETIPDHGLELWPQAGASFNIGIMMFRPKSMLFVGGNYPSAFSNKCLQD